MKLILITIILTKMHLRTVIKDQQTNKKRNKGQEEQILKQINKRENTKGTKVINHQPA